MQIVEATSLDSIADYALREAPLPEPGPGQLRIAVAACGVGYVDALVSLGRYQVKPPLPHVPGQEVAGRVAALGEGVTGFAVGERVMATVRGGFAQAALAEAADVWAKGFRQLQCSASWPAGDCIQALQTGCAARTDLSDGRWQSALPPRQPDPGHDH